MVERVGTGHSCLVWFGAGRAWLCSGSGRCLADRVAVVVLASARLRWASSRRARRWRQQMCRQAARQVIGEPQRLRRAAGDAIADVGPAGGKEVESSAHDMAVPSSCSSGGQGDDVGSVASRGHAQFARGAGRRGFGGGVLLVLAVKETVGPARGRAGAVRGATARGSAAGRAVVGRAPNEGNGPGRSVARAEGRVRSREARRCGTLRGRRRA